MKCRCCGRPTWDETETYCNQCDDDLAAVLPTAQAEATERCEKLIRGIRTVSPGVPMRGVFTVRTVWTAAEVAEHIRETMKKKDLENAFIVLQGVSDLVLPQAARILDCIVERAHREETIYVAGFHV